MEGIAGKVHVITGGYGGIASATARLIAAHGGIVVLTGRDVEAGQRRADELKAETAADVRFYQMDVTDSVAVEKAAQSITKEVGPVHGVVINAAMATIAPALAHSDADWRKVMATNVDGAFYCARSFARVMQDRGGSIVVISSISARTGVGPHIAYSASKAAVSHMARVLGVEWASLGIRVNAVEPGYTLTAAIAHMKRDAPEVAAQLEGQVPQGRFLQPEEIGNVVHFLLSDLSSGMTGAVVVVDGGLSAR